MDASIILQGRPFDALGAMGAGNALAQQTNALGDQNRLRDLYSTQGPGIMAGQQPALNALAQIDPSAALNIKSVYDAARAKAAEAAQTMDDKTRAETAAKMDGIVKGASYYYANHDQAGYEHFLTAHGADPAQFPFEQLPAILAGISGGSDAMKSYTPAPVEQPNLITGAPAGFRFRDETRVAVDPIQGAPPPAPDLTADQKNYQFYVTEEQKAGRTPASFNDWNLQGKRAGASSSTTTINQTGDNAFDKAMGEKQAATFSAIIDQGMTAQQSLATLDQMGALLDKTPTGGEAVFKGLLGQYGIATEGLSDIQALDSLINKLVPAQRVAGSGTSSDNDTKAFRASLPSLINQPGGNKIILDGMRRLAQYSIAQGDIAQQVANGEISRADGAKQLRALPSPLAGFNTTTGSSPAATAPAPTAPVAGSVLNFDATGSLIP